MYETRHCSKLNKTQWWWVSKYYFNLVILRLYWRNEIVIRVVIFKPTNQNVFESTFTLIKFNVLVYLTAIMIIIFITVITMSDEGYKLAMKKYMIDKRRVLYRVSPNHVQVVACKFFHQHSSSLFYKLHWKLMVILKFAHAAQLSGMNSSHCSRSYCNRTLHNIDLKCNRSVSQLVSVALLPTLL